MAERECSRRFLAIRKITKLFPAAVTIESSQPKTLSQFSILTALLKPTFLSFAQSLLAILMSRKASCLVLFHVIVAAVVGVLSFQRKCWAVFSDDTSGNGRV